MNNCKINKERYAEMLAIYNTQNASKVPENWEQYKIEMNGWDEAMEYDEYAEEI